MRSRAPYPSAITARALPLVMVFATVTALWLPIPKHPVDSPGFAQPRRALPIAAPCPPPCSPHTPLPDWRSASLAIKLPLECRGLGILSAEELEYEGGLRETRVVLEGFLGQENVFVSALVDLEGAQVSTVTASAERLSLLVPEPHVPSVQASLEALGFPVVREKYGARTLHVRIPTSSNFVRALDMLESMLRGRGEVSLCSVSLAP